jgi:undecaprenyl-diphosphatase
MKRLIGISVSLATTFATTAYFALRSPYFPVDLRISLWLQQFDGLLLPVMSAASLISSRLPATIIVVSVAIWLGKSNRRLEAIITGTANAISALTIVPAVKSLVGRPRPASGLIQVISLSLEPGFPSGHAAFVILFYGFLFYLLPGLSGHKTVVKTIRILLAVLIGLTLVSRIYLGSHWASDVLGGALLGGLVLVVSIIIYCHYLPGFSRRVIDA